MFRCIKKLTYKDIVGNYKYDNASSSNPQPHFFDIMYVSGNQLYPEARTFLYHVLPDLPNDSASALRYLSRIDRMFFNYSSNKYVNKKFIDILKNRYIDEANINAGDDGNWLNLTLDDFDRFLYKELKEFNYKDSMGHWENNNYIHGVVNDYVKPSSVVKNAIQDFIPILLNKYMDKWLKIYDAMNTQYAPLDNYNMIEHEEYNEAENVKTSHNVDETSKTSHNVDSTSKTSHNIDVDSEVLNNDTTNKINGFNSATASPTNETHSESKENQKALATDNYDETTNTAEAIDNYDETKNTAEAENNYDNVERSKDKDDNFRDLTRHGNIGVTTSQQMLESEIDLRMNNNFWKIVFNDISNEMFLQKF